MSDDYVSDDDYALLAAADSFTDCSKGQSFNGFDELEGKTWVYPINYPLRSYQFNIVQKALLWNTLVTLPTGLGKTFVAAVVMFNFYRWFPRGKILFMAPTRPLVAQQIRACHDIVGIPQDELGELTGSLNPMKRDVIWRQKRVFFLTPQIVQNDLGRGSCPAAEIVLLVVDEAHKATGNHAYCQVVRELTNYKKDFRVLALSATPGDNLATAQSVLTNLLISHVEIRSEESIDIQPYLHSRNVKKIILPLDRGLSHLKSTFLQKVLSGYVQVLTTHRAIYCGDPQNLSKYTLLQQRESWRARNGQSAPQTISLIEGVYFTLMNLYHAYELLLVHGASTFVDYCRELLEGRKGNAGTKAKLLHDLDFMSLVDMVGRWRSSGVMYELDNEPFVDHPKKVKLLELLGEHFKAGGESNTRAMVFSSYRESVADLVRIINRHSPKLKSTEFIGQSGAKGLKQKQQIKTIQDFKRGEYNILVATCVGEEGLDIGSVDLIVCFDASASPTRLVQRMGRAARKRDGSIVVLLTEGKEETVYKRSLSTKQSVSKTVMTKLHKLVLYQHNPRMVPKHLNPVPVKKVLEPKTYTSPAAAKEKRKSRLPKHKNPFLTSSQFNAYCKDEPFKSSKFSLASCLSKWMHWQATEHPSFDVHHSISTLTFVHILQANELFQTEKSAIDKYEKRRSQYLDLNDVIVASSKCENKAVSVDDQKLSQKLKQKTLYAYKDKKVSLFSCVGESAKLPKNTATAIPAPAPPIIDVDSADETEVVADSKVANNDPVIDIVSTNDKESTTDSNDAINSEPEDTESVTSSSEESLPQLGEVKTDIIGTQQLDESLSTRLKTKQIPVTEVPPPMTCADIADDSFDEKDISKSLFQVINDTWEYELSQDPHVPSPPSESIPDIDLSLDFNIFSQKENSNPNDSSLLNVTEEKKSLNQCENMFGKLAAREKYSESEDDLPDVTLQNFSLSDSETLPINDQNEVSSNSPNVERKCLSRQRKSRDNRDSFHPKNASTPLVPPAISNPISSVTKQKALDFKSPTIKKYDPSDEISPLIIGKRKRFCNILATQNVSDNMPEESKSNTKRQKCQFIDDEAENEDSAASDDDEEDEGNIITASLADFIDHSASVGEGDTAMYMRDLNFVNNQNTVRKVGMGTDSIDELDPFTQDEYHDEKGSFICDDEEYTQLDCLEETAVFTQQLAGHTPKAIIPTQYHDDLQHVSPIRSRLNHRKKRVLEFSSSQTPEKDKLEVTCDTKLANVCNSPLKPLQNCCPGASTHQSPKTQHVPADDSTFDLDIDNLLNDETVNDTDEDFKCPKDRAKPLALMLPNSVTSNQQNNSSVADLFDTSLTDSMVNKVTDIHTSQFELGHENLLDDTSDRNIAVKPVTFSDLRLTSIRSCEDSVVFVRSKTVSNNQICSFLRTRHKLKLEVSEDVVAVDYIPNSMVGICRVSLTDLYKNFNEITSKARDASVRFQNLVYIVELPPQTKKKIGQKVEEYDAKRVARAEHYLKPYSVSIVVSTSQDRTAEIIAGLVGSDVGRTIPQTAMTDKQHYLEKILVSIPYLNNAVARLLALHFKSLRRIVNCSAEEIIKETKLSSRNTALLLKYLKTNISKS